MASLKGIDWDAARARLGRLAAAHEEGDTLSPEAASALLDERARELARPPSPELAPGTLREVVRFRAAGQRYALESRFVLEVVRPSEVVPLPGAPPALRGLTLLHGGVLPVVELAPLFGRAPTNSTGPLLVVGKDQPELGVRTEEVEEVTLVSSQDLLPPPATLADEAAGLVFAAERDGVLLLEGAALLADGRLTFDLSDEGVV
ncbi:chemotaxis protein CheW [Myxococcus sp. K15C18031901]|uniref:chemotaxis protein CheW n=1 Tax=Myxococcus dinghuensis TaxID=2906761 RepID=UPI0020A731DA|nr:chemotaxis protein CheW [Myxococcus dinghuensis]MCP3099634.1 chemotaxis protein CheW [Myxococcus dinghuensis]